MQLRQSTNLEFATFVLQNILKKAEGPGKIFCGTAWMSCSPRPQKAT